MRRGTMATPPRPPPDVETSPVRRRCTPPVLSDNAAARVTRARDAALLSGRHSWRPGTQGTMTNLFPPCEERPLTPHLRRKDTAMATSPCAPPDVETSSDDAAARVTRARDAAPSSGWHSWRPGTQGTMTDLLPPCEERPQTPHFRRTDKELRPT